MHKFTAAKKGGGDVCAPRADENGRMSGIVKESINLLAFLAHFTFFRDYFVVISST